MSERPTHCQTCGKSLSRRNRIGYCRAHASAAIAQSESWQEAHSAGIRRTFSDPNFMDAHRARCREIAVRPEVREKRRQKAVAMGLSKIGHSALANDPALRDRRARKFAATMLPDVPPHLLDDYRTLRRAEISVAEAKAIVREADARAVAAVRARMGRKP